MGKWYVRPTRRINHEATITGESLPLAASDYVRKLASMSVDHDHLMTDIKLEELSYRESILGGNGGVVARISYHDEVTGCYETVDAWIYANEDYTPKKRW